MRQGLLRQKGTSSRLFVHLENLRQGWSKKSNSPPPVREGSDLCMHRLAADTMTYPCSAVNAIVTPFNQIRWPEQLGLSARMFGFFSVFPRYNSPVWSPFFLAYVPCSSLPSRCPRIYPEVVSYNPHSTNVMEPPFQVGVRFLDGVQFPGSSAWWTRRL